MNYLYHKVPPIMKGRILYPLNELINIFPEIYEKQKIKYESREHIMQQHIPQLNCLWNDVLHFTAVDPAQIADALQDGIKVKYFKIDAAKLDPAKTVIYLYSKPGAPDESQIVEYDPITINKYSQLPGATIEYYKKMSELNKKPLLFHLVPHILFKGNLDIADAEIVEV